MNPARKLEKMLRLHNFKLVRQDKHIIYQNHEGKTFVTASTPSDYRAAHNAVAQLNRVISNPVQAMVLAISDYEREMAAQRIAGQPKPQVGLGGKSQHSKGTGFIYEDRNVLTEEDKRRRENHRKQALENKERRREKKLAQRAAVEQERQEFEKKFGEFLEFVEQHADKGLDKFYTTWRAHGDNKAWGAETFYEFNLDADTRAIERMVHASFKFAVGSYTKSVPFVEIGDAAQKVIAEKSHAVLTNETVQRNETVSAVVRTVRRMLQKGSSISNVKRVLDNEVKRDFAADNSSAWGWAIAAVVYAIQTVLAYDTEELGDAAPNPDKSPLEMGRAS